MAVKVPYKSALLVILVLGLFSFGILPFTSSLPIDGGNSGGTYSCGAATDASYIGALPSCPSGMGEQTCARYERTSLSPLVWDRSDADADGDGYWWHCGQDCDDNNNQIYPGHPLSCSNNKDNDCNGIIDADEEACQTPFTATITGPAGCGSSCTIAQTSFTLEADTTYQADCKYDTSSHTDYDSCSGCSAMGSPDGGYTHQATISQSSGTVTYYIYCRIPRS